MSWNKIKDNLRRKLKRQHLRVLTFLILMLLQIFILGFLFIIFTNLDSKPSTTESDTPNILNEAKEEEENENVFFTDASEPTKITIPSINLEADFETPLGVDKDNNMKAPVNFNKVARYLYAPTPGELGPAVVLGHVDSKEGPAIFYSLGQIKKEDEIIITREDNKKLTFEIFEIERVKQNYFPTEKVYGNISYAGIRLITCSGYYDRGSLRYSHNLILYGKLVEINDFD